VLKIRLGAQSILLPGDIERPMEYYLMDYHYGQLASTVIVAPHHGSNSSSMATFIKAVDPEYVLYAAGFENRYHHPAMKVQRRYYNQGILSYNTAYNGAIWFDFYHNGEMKVATWVKSR